MEQCNTVFLYSVVYLYKVQLINVYDKVILFQNSRMWTRIFYVCQMAHNIHSSVYDTKVLLMAGSGSEPLPFLKYVHRFLLL
jgi:hypothetical protein